MADPAPPRLLVFSDLTRASQGAMLARFNGLAAAARPRSVLFTLRDYTLPVRARLALGAELAVLAGETEQLFGIADRADIARLLRADALHLPESGVPVRDARAFVGPNVFLSRACHEPHRVAAAGADAVLLSPIFASRKGRPALGLTAVEQARRAPVESQAMPALYALGAVDAGNAACCLAAGATGVAVIGAALALDPRPLLEALEICRR